MAYQKEEASIAYYIYFDNPPEWSSYSILEWRHEISNVLKDAKEFFYIVKYKNNKIVELLNEYMED